MSGQHATSAELELYVLGALDADRIESFEAHCAACDACAAALSGEAKLEIAFEQVSRRIARVQVLRPVRAVAYGAAGLVAMAAAALLWIGHAPGTAAAAAGEGTASVSRAPATDGAILDARNDALDGG
jgi:anti-sigma factor RsiW